MTVSLAPRALGRTGLTCFPVGLGTARLGAFWQGRSVADGRAALRTALDGGIDLLDTADCYARGVAERLVGRAATGRTTCVMTKVGLVKTPLAVASAARHDRATGGRLGGLRPGPAASTCFAPDYVRAAVTRCLRRQAVSRLDAVLLHEPSAEQLRDGAFLPAVRELVDQGRVQHWGASVRDAGAALEAVRLPGLSILQVPCSAVDSSVVDAVRDEARENGVALVAVAALGDGELLARARGLRPRAPAADVVAALGWQALRTPGVDAVLLGMSSPDHVADVLAALPRVDEQDTEALAEQLSGSD